MSYSNIANCLKLILSFSLMLLCLIGKSQNNFADVDAYILTNQKLLGKDFAAVIFKDGKVIYKKEAGEFTIKSKASITGSSKWLTAALLMTFVDEGKISLDDKVSKYLPIFATYGKAYITISNCLSHTTGIADNQKILSKLFTRSKFESLEDEVNSFPKKEIDTNPGTSFSYGEVGCNIVGRILEIVSKKKFDVLIKQRIFTPLNMKSSSFTPEDNAVNPSGGAISTAADYMNFLTMILDKGMFAGKRILSEKAIAQMQTIQTNNIPKKYTPKLAEGFEYGLGEWIQEKDEKGNSTVVSCPSLFGTWPYIDKCRGYACILFNKNLLGEQKKDFYLELKKTIDKQIPTTCN